MLNLIEHDFKCHCVFVFFISLSGAGGRKVVLQMMQIECERKKQRKEELAA
jgi:hypothetical protein